MLLRNLLTGKNIFFFCTKKQIIALFLITLSTDFNTFFTTLDKYQLPQNNAYVKKKEAHDEPVWLNFQL
jgi:hypothetical protein